MAAIPMSQIISVTPKVISAGGNALSMGLVVLTQDSAVVPAGTLINYPDLASVKTAFGASSDQAKIAEQYFKGFTLGSQVPGFIGFFGVVTTGGGYG